MTAPVDLTPEPEVERVAEIACRIAELLRSEPDLGVLWTNLVSLCYQHPAKAAQLLMAYAAWLDLDEITTGQLWVRAEHATSARVELVRELRIGRLDGGEDRYGL